MTVHAQELIALLVPTINRWEFVERLLGYYHALRFRGQIVLADASEGEAAARTREAAEGFVLHLAVRYHALPGQRTDACWRQLNALMTTPYVTFVGDDDFLVPSGLARCVEWLQRHPDYHAAHGRAALFRVRGDRAHGDVIGVRPYSGLRSLEGGRSGPAPGAPAGVLGGLVLRASDRIVAADVASGTGTW